VNKQPLLSVFLAAILIGGLVLAEAMRFRTVQAKPSVPEFTLKYVDYSYDVPPTYGIDQYTGKTIITNYGKHIDNRTIEITIKNQPFTPYNNSNGNTINRFYDVRYKGSYTTNWTTMFANQTQFAMIGDYQTTFYEYGYAIQDYSSPYTTIIYQLDPTEGSMDFQVEALEGFTLMTYYEGFGFHSIYGFSFNGQESGWSNTQTITFGGSQTPTPSLSPSPTATSSPAPTPTPYQEPTQTEQIEPILGAAIVVAAIIIGVGLLIYLTKRK
jgi:hypothetical protein